MAENTTNYQCPACTGPLRFDSASGKLCCDYCGSTYDVAQVEALYGEKQARADKAAEAAEKALFAELAALEPKVQALFAEGRYEEMLVSLAALRAPVDAFFEAVMVNAEDAALRANRQALLGRLYDVMNRVADIARLAQ